MTKWTGAKRDSEHTNSWMTSITLRLYGICLAFMLWYSSFMSAGWSIRWTQWHKLTLSRALQRDGLFTWFFTNQATLEYWSCSHQEAVTHSILLANCWCQIRRSRKHMRSDCFPVDYENREGGLPNLSQSTAHSCGATYYQLWYDLSAHLHSTCVCQKYSGNFLLRFFLYFLYFHCCLI